MYQDTAEKPNFWQSLHVFLLSGNFKGGATWDKGWGNLGHWCGVTWDTDLQYK